MSAAENLPLPYCNKCGSRRIKYYSDHLTCLDCGTAANILCDYSCECGSPNISSSGLTWRCRDCGIGGSFDNNVFISKLVRRNNT